MESAHPGLGEEGSIDLVEVHVPKLVIDFDLEFEAGPIMARNRKLLRNVKVPAAQLRALVGQAVPEDFAVNACLLKAGEVVYQFDCRFPVRGKVSVFDRTFDFRRRSVKVVAKGELATRPLRAGVAPFIQRLGKRAEFRLWGLHYRDGAWNGFEAPVIGLEEVACTSWVRLRSWRLK